MYGPQVFLRLHHRAASVTSRVSPKVGFLRSCGGADRCLTFVACGRTLVTHVLSQTRRVIEVCWLGLALCFTALLLHLHFQFARFACASSLTSPYLVSYQIVLPVSVSLGSRHACRLCWTRLPPRKTTSSSCGYVDRLCWPWRGCAASQLMVMAHHLVVLWRQVLPSWYQGHRAAAVDEMADIFYTALAEREHDDGGDTLEASHPSAAAEPAPAPEPRRRPLYAAMTQSPLFKHFASLLGVNVRDTSVNETTTEAAAATVAASRKANAASDPTMASSENDQGEGDVAAAATLTASTPPVVAVVESDGSVIDVTGDGGATDTSGSSHAGEAAGDDTVDASDSGKPPPQSPSPDDQPSSLNDEDRALMAEFMDAADEVLDEFEDCRLPDVQPCRVWRVCPHLMPFIAVGCVHGSSYRLPIRFFPGQGSAASIH